MNENQLIDLLSQAWFGTFIGLVLGVVGIAVGIWLYFLGKQRPVLRYLVSHSILLSVREGDYANDLEIKFRGVPVPRLVASTIAIWNDGNTTLTGSQIVPTDPLRAIIQDDAKILDATIVAKSRPALEQTLHDPRGSNEVAVSFDFLEPGDGFLLQILHSGEYGRAGLTGTLIGLGGGPRRWMGSGIFTKPKRHMFFSFAASGLLLLAVLGMGSAVRLVQGGPLTWWEIAPLALVGFFSLALGPMAPDFFARRRLARFPPSLRDQPAIAFSIQNPS